MSLTNTFYEKVVKVKADVAAILIFSATLSGRSRLTIWAQPQRGPSGGCARGVSAEQSWSWPTTAETPLAGGAAASMRASAFCWHTACQRRGGNPPAHAFPRRGKRERGSSDFLAAADNSRWRGAGGRHASWLSMCSLLSTFLSRLRSPTIDFDPLKPLSRSLAGATHSLPCFYPHSKRL